MRIFFFERKTGLEGPGQAASIHRRCIFYNQAPKVKTITKKAYNMQKGPCRINRTRSGPRIPLQGFRRTSDEGRRHSTGDETTWAETAGGHLNGEGEADGAVALPPLSLARRRARRREIARELAPEKPSAAGGRRSSRPP
jgi:hypothetical protein